MPVAAVLQSFGLTPLEAELYETLLLLGDVPMAELIKKTQRHPQVVYRLVERLASHGLVLSSVRRHRKYVRAEDPEVFLHTQDRKIEELRSALPSLKALQHAPREANVRVERGIEAVRGLRRRAWSELVRGETYYIFSASGDAFYNAMGDTLQPLERMRIHRGVRKKLLAFESQREHLEQREAGWRVLSEIRYLPEEHPVPASTNIYGSVTAIQIWAEEPIVIVIESAEVARSYLDYFNVLWKTARK